MAHSIKLVAELSERNVNGNSRVIRIFANGQHVYTRTCKLNYFGNIESHKSTFKPAKERHFSLSSSFCQAVKDFANSFGKDGYSFRTYASREKTLYVRETRSRRSQSSDSNGAAVAAGALFGALIVAALKD